MKKSLDDFLEHLSRNLKIEEAVKELDVQTEISHEAHGANDRNGGENRQQNSKRIPRKRTYVRCPRMEEGW